MYDRNLLINLKLWHILLLASVLLAPVFFATLATDDLFHYFVLNGNTVVPPVADSSLWGLFSFVDNDQLRNQSLTQIGMLPWWHSEEFTWRFFRPLTEVSLFVDYKLFGDHFFLMHVHSLLWYLLAIALAYYFFGILFTDYRHQILATLLFAIDGAHGVAVSWLSARSPIIATVFILAFIICHDKHIKKPAFYLPLLSALFFTASLFTAEIGVLAAVYLFAYCLFIDERPATHKIKHFAAYFGIGLVWLFCYLLGDYGVVGSNDHYLSPNHQPLAFLHRYLEIIIFTSFNFWTSVPTDFYAGEPAKTVFLLLGLVGIILIFKAFRHYENKKLIYFLIVISILGLVPVAGAPLQDRNLLTLNISFSALMSIVLIRCFDGFFNGGKVLKIITIYLVAAQIVFHLVWMPIYSNMPTLVNDFANARAKTLQYENLDNIVLLSTSTAETLYLAPRLLFFNQRLPERLWNLTGEQKDYTLEKIDEHRIRLTHAEGFITHFEEFVRNLNHLPFNTSDVVKFEDLSIHIEKTNALGQPTQFVAEFERPLKDLRFVSLKNGRFIDVDIFNQ